ncbi:MAG: glutathione S-transferase, partial [Gammaproteobacteria bacterium]|nr:glutathione S-transferase [Gammaproteobacteria bacterium]
MKLYNSIGPNPHVVRMFIQELGIELETIEVDLMSGENRQEDHLNRNPSGQVPTLELDDGNHVSEITAICEYLDELQGNTDLIGKTASERAETRMWTRRIDLQIIEPLTNGFRAAEGYDLFKDRLRLLPQAADDLKTLAQERLTWLNGQLDGKEFVCGDRFSLADIMFYCFLNFGTTVGQALNE